MFDIFDQAEEEVQNRFYVNLAYQQEKSAHYKNKTNITDCVECDDPIPRARKSALPHVTRCIECQEMMERK